MTGKVYLVGAGPGDPELLTIKAARLLRTADVVLHDDLVAREILDVIPSTAFVRNVGKRCGHKSISQAEINFTMLTLAASGMHVVRLKSGDPLIFGRGGEEIDALRRAGVPFEVVPGVTSALAAAAIAHIPLTDRRAASTVVFMTAHQAPAKGDPDWKRIANGRSTLVIYMPGANYAEMARRLVSAGLNPDTPCAIISRATTPEQRVHTTTIEKLHLSPYLAAPTLLMVGDVVRLSHAWTDQLDADSGEFAEAVAARAQDSEVFPSNQRSIL
jgi:uroporphyrin-III C-methyltransferase